MGPLVRLLAIAASTVIALSLILFAVDQSGDGTDAQLRSLDGGSAAGTRAPAVSREDLNAPNPAPAAERAREAQHSSVREYIDDANDLLTAPFTGVAGSDNVWVERLVSAGIGLVLFGLGGLLLANWLPERRSAHQDWQQTTG